MPVNPEVEARERLVKSVRVVADGAGVGSGSKVALRQAANEIEDLGAFKEEQHEAFLHRVSSDIKEMLHELYRRETMGYEPLITFIREESGDEPLFFSVRAEARPLKVNLEVRVERG